MSAAPPQVPSTSPAVPPARAELLLRSLSSLDWSKVVAALVERAHNGIGQSRCEGEILQPDLAAAQQMLRHTAEASSVLSAGEDSPTGAVVDLSGLLVAAAKGDILDGEDLRVAGSVLEGLGRLLDFHRRHSDRAPGILSLAQQIRPLPDLAAWILSSFDARGELSASAYPQLASLRTKKARLHEQIRSTMEALRGSERFAERLQDDFLALRNDRYVLPVKVGSKGAGLGIVHDASGSGQTVFVEPFEVVELNNELKMAESELRNEELRILRDLGERLGAFAFDIRRSLHAAGEIDAIFARARLARDLRAHPPKVVDEGVFELVQARHPVLELRGVDVVANDVRLGRGGACALVLSGPNTGGKTVTLKTLGLFALMARAGLPIPAEPGSVVGWFPQVLTDIGDAQDVAGDLSTFSGHVRALVEIFDAVDSSEGRSLVLLDEIAVGTDPVQGASLGRAVLEALLDRGTLLATTTHYPELKALAASDPRFVNGRAEFDDELGRPTFRIAYGRPGSSHALDVAARVGLPAAVLEAARHYLGPTSVQVEELLAGLETANAKAREERETARRLREELEAQRERLNRSQTELEAKRKTVERDLRVAFDREVKAYRDRVRAAFSQLDRERTKEGIGQVGRAVDEGADVVRAGLAPLPREDKPRIEWATARVGSAVYVPTLGKDAVVQQLPDNKGRLVVAVDGRRIQAMADELEPPRDKRKRAEQPAPVSILENRKGPKSGASRSGQDPDPFSGAHRTGETTLDLRGRRVDEALLEVDRFLDRLSGRGREFAFLLHGIGTGALYGAIRDHLRDSPYHGRSAPAPAHQGGEGVTVVWLRGAAD